MFKKVLPLSLVLLTGSALAGGSMISAPVAADSGFYAGAGVGFMAKEVKSEVSGLPGPVSRYNESTGDTALKGQVFAGYQYQWMPDYDVTVEGFLSYQDAKIDIAQVTPNGKSSFKTKYTFGFKVMPGMSVSQSLHLFGDLGVAWGCFEYLTSTLARANGAPAKYTNTKTALLLGLGADYALSSLISLRTEYTYLDFSSWNIVTPVGVNTVRTKFDSSANQFVASLIYHFSS